MVQKLGGKAVEIFLDSRLVMGQVKGELEARNVRMQEHLNQVRHLQSRFESFNLLHVPRSGNTHADSLATLATSQKQGLPRVILVEDLCKPTKMKKEMIYILEWDLTRWTLQCYSLKRISCLRKSQKLTKCEEKLISSGCPMTKSCISAIFLGHICYVYTLRHQSHSWRIYMKGFVEVTQEAGLSLIESSFRDIDGQSCKRKYKSM